MEGGYSPQKGCPLSVQYGRRLWSRKWVSTVSAVWKEVVVHKGVSTVSAVWKEVVVQKRGVYCQCSWKEVVVQKRGVYCQCSMEGGCGPEKGCILFAV